MLSEEYKKQAFDLLDQMSAEELEEVLQKIGSIKASRSNNTVRERRRMNRFDNFFPCFDELMQMGKGGKCKIVLKYHSVSRKSDETLKASFCINQVKTPHGIEYKTIENYTGGTDPSIVGMRNRYSLETLLLTLFDDDFQKYVIGDKFRSDVERIVKNHILPVLQDMVIDALQPKAY